MSASAADQNWETFHLEKVRQSFPRWPNEVMLKLLFGNYLKTRFTVDPSMRVLDVGCGFGNNLLPFIELGCECHGTEVTDKIAALASELAVERGYSASIRAGHNQSLPYDEAYFDLLLSINVLHYEKTEDDVQASLAEYCRVLKANGAMLLVTVGPEHAIYESAKVVGPHQFVIQYFDFRDGEQYFYFDNLKYLAYFVDDYFEDVETGQILEIVDQRPPLREDRG